MPCYHGVDRLVPFRADQPLPPAECDLEVMELAHALRLRPEAAPPPYLVPEEPVSEARQRRTRWLRIWPGHSGDRCVFWWSSGQDWRWMDERRDGPWYPRMRLHRQGEAGSWAEPRQEVRRDLERALPRE